MTKAEVVKHGLGVASNKIIAHILAAEKQAKAVAEPVVDVPPNVSLGNGVINDHEQRIWKLEKEAGLR